MELAREGTIDPSWLQGRGAFGGLVAAIFVRAMEEEVADPSRRLRSLTVHFPSPATGAYRVRSSIVRAGRAVTHVRAELEAERGIAAFATASFCASREHSPSYSNATMPDVAPPGEASPLSLPSGVAPEFLSHVDVRFVGPSFPFSGSARPAPIAAWVRLREPPVAIDAAMAALYLDTLPPAITVLFTGRKPVASVDFTVQIFDRLPRADLRPDDHLLVSIASRWADDGYTEEIRDLWTPSGVHLATCRQLLAIL